MNSTFEKEEKPYLFQVNLGGMIDILSNHLYSSPDVFVRELLQNGVDAISAKNPAEIPADAGESDCITLSVGEENGKRQLCFTDTGTGLTEAQIHQFLAVIGQSSKHNVREKKQNEDFIGRFGIGLLSCFLVADEIRLQTRSRLEPNRALEWRGKPDGTYTITEIPPRAFGSAVLLTPKAGAEGYFTPEKLADLVRYYGMPLPVPVYLEQDGEKTRLNPPFPTGKTATEGIMALGESLFHTTFLDYITLESPTGLFSGVAYILAQESAPTAKQAHRIYLKNMLLTEDGSRFLPKWAFFLRFFLNTNKLRPTASREDFYEDENLLHAREELLVCISDYLKRLSHTDGAKLQRIVRTHRLAVQSVAAEDDALFCAFFPYLTFETSYGTLSGKDLAGYSEEIYYTQYVDEFRQVSAVLLAKGMLLVNAGYTYVRQLLERIELLNPQARVHALKMRSLDSMLGGISAAEEESAAGFLHACGEILRPYDCAPGLKRFEPDELPVLYTLDENALMLRDVKRSMEKSDALFMGMLGAFAQEYADDAAARLYFNANNPFVRRLLELRDAERLACCVRIIYVQALLTGGYAMRGNELAMLSDSLLKLLDWSV